VLTSWTWTWPGSRKRPAAADPAAIADHDLPGDRIGTVLTGTVLTGTDPRPGLLAQPLRW
jgi:hypothetical protein